MRYLKAACGIFSSLCTTADCQYTQMILPSWPRVAVMLGIWQGRSSPARRGGIVSRQILCSVTSQLLHLWGWTSDLSPLLLLFFLLLFEWLRFHGISIFLGWLKINSVVKDGEKV